MTTATGISNRANSGVNVEIATAVSVNSVLHSLRFTSNQVMSSIAAAFADLMSCMYGC
jgi:hypothetical protein